MNLPNSHKDSQHILSLIIQDFMQFMRKSGISMPQAHVLLYIYHSPRGMCTLSEICELSESSKPAASQLVERLIKQELVKSEEDPADRRNKKLRLTDKSLKLIQKGIHSNRLLMQLMKTIK